MALIDRFQLRHVALLLLLAGLVCVTAGSQQPLSGDDEETLMRSIQVTRWADPNTRPNTYAEYLVARRQAGYALDAPFEAKLTYRSPDDVFRSPKRLDVLVDTGLMKEIDPDLAQYVRDLEIEGWSVSLFVCTGGTPPEVRSFLQKRHTADRILGCVMIGNLPVAWYEMDDDWNNAHSEFPSDLYYMDLNGDFGDVDHDGKFDSHNELPGGNQQPDIFLGRLYASPLAGAWGTEVELVKNYFRKLHAYRIGTLSAPERALAFQDDDWYTMGTYQEYAYTSVTKISDKYETTAANYRTRLSESYESALVCAHSSPSVHAFKVPGSSGGSLSNSTLWALDPPCLFYNLFACSNARYTSTRYMGGVYIFVKSMGLIAVGTTKTGSMLYFNDYYAPLGQQKTFGEAFRSWFAARWPYSLGDRRWFYGMTLLGDPTLRIDRALLTATYKTKGPATGFTIDFQLNGRPDHAGQNYVLLAAQTGTVPGVTFPGVRIPINWDLYSWFFYFALNSQAWPRSLGTLDNQARATSTFTHAGVIPKVLIGQEIHFTALLIDRVSQRYLQATPPATIKVTEK
jgi:peptidase C25-like protein